MASLKQLEANRRNAQLSSGPTTPEGKAAVRFNSLKSGIHAIEQVVPGEDPEELQTFATDLTESCHPADTREQVLVDQMVAHGWRLRRLLKAEPKIWERLFTVLQGSKDFSADFQLADAFHHNPQILLRLQRLIASVQRSYHEAAADLDRLQAARAKSAQTQPHQPESAQPHTPEIGFVPSTLVNRQASEASHPTPASGPRPLPPTPDLFRDAGNDLSV